MRRRRPPALLAISTGGALTVGASTGAAGARALERAVASAVAAGLRGVVLREPHMGDGAYLELALALRALLAPERGGWLCVHDRPHLAAACDADAVHLGQRSLAPADVRPWLDERFALGLSTHAGDDPANWATADYLVHGPVHAVHKPHARPPIGAQGMALAVAAAPVPVWALGGVRPEDIPELLAAGVAGVAVMSRLLGAPDPAAATAAFLAALDAQAT